MSCTDIADTFLRRRVAVLDVRSRTWTTARAQLLPPGYTTATCLHRLAAAGRIRRLKRGLYIVVDTVRETPPVAIASGIFAELDHYVTTDAALTVHGLIDQPLPTITVVLPTVRRPIQLGRSVVRPVSLAADRFAQADAYSTTVDGFAVRLASREQAVVDAVAEPGWMIHGTLLPEILAAFDDGELARAAERALDRTTAAAQRLGYLLDEAGREPPPTLAALRPTFAVNLRPGHHRGPYSTRWRVYG
jgi:predicted transcriptional regulator of viral defense system